ncbi:MAG: hypothetical protein JW760_06330, partial [Spirochaetales bacterium]|nr:hypothetical protein [Spirochaetales bacterium]
MKKTASIISLLVALALIAGCGNPISQSILDLNKDETGPVITITSPAEGSAYAKTVGVTGTVTDAVSTGDEANSGALASLTYQVAAAGIQTTAVEVADGAFSFQFSAASLTGTIVVTIVATDQNGNDSVKNLTLIDAGNDIPSFTAIPGNRSVTLQWGVVPGAQDYTIYYTTNNTSPSEYYYHGQILPAETAGGLNEETGIYSYTLSTHNGSSLKNGSMHGFLLKASGTVGEETLDNYSAVEQAIPLSGTTLCPLVRGGAGCVVLEWNVLEGTDSFNVYRRESGSDEAIRIAYNYEGNSFSDDNAEADTWYFYSVAPAMDNGVVSSENTGTMVPVDDCPLESILLDTQGEGKEVVVSGNYAYVAEGYTDDGGMLSIYNIGNTNRIRLVGSLLVEAENSRVEDIVISGEYAYLAVDEFGLVIVDISNPASPQVAGTCEDPDIYSSYSIDLDGNYVYLGGSNSIARVDVSNPSTLSATVEIASASLYDVAVSGNYVIGMYQYGSTIYVHNKSTLAEVDTADTSVDIGAAYMPYSVACYGGRLYVGLRDSNLGNPAGMCIYNINPGTGELTLLEDIDGSGDDMLDTPAKVEDICIHDDMCYVTYENGTSGLTSTVKGLIAWDITDPATPVEKMSMDLDGTPLSIFRTEAILAVCGYQGLKVFDFSNNLTPSEEVLTYPNLVSVAGDIIRRGDYTYMVDMVVSMPDEYALKVFSQPGTSAPTLSTSLPLEYGPRHMAV